MALTTKTIKKHPALVADLVLNPDIAAAPRSPMTHDTHFLATQQGGIQEDLLTGCLSGQTITGPTRTPTPGKDVVINFQATGHGTLTVQDSEDGTTWTNRQSFPVVGGDAVQGARFTFASGFYRVQFTASTQAAVSKVGVHSQSRT